MRPSEQSHSNILHDEGGAIMVFGLFACVLLVGVLWTVIGVGEMTAFRERAQDAADSAAYSTAVMVSRGMNTIVLFNILMSLVLAVRVALKVLQFACIVAGIALCATIVGIPAGVALFSAAGSVQAAINSTNPGINTALQGLQTVSQGVQTALPAFAMGAGRYSGRQYAPIVERVFVAAPDNDGPSARVSPPGLREDQFAGVPCGKAGAAAVELMLFIVGKILDVLGMGSFVEAVKGPLETAVKGLVGNPVTALYFCELGVNIHPPPTESLDKVADAARKDCLKKLGFPEDHDKFDDPLTPAQQSALQGCTEGTTNAAQAAKDHAAGAASKVANRKFGMPPTFNLDQWSNGDPGSQIISVVTLHPESALRAGKGVSIAAHGASVSDAPPAEANKAFAQAETYYDCAGHWVADCHGMEEAMWNFAWRARLVSVDPEAAFIKTEVDQATAAVKATLSKTGPAGPPVNALTNAKSLMVH